MRLVSPYLVHLKHWDLVVLAYLVIETALILFNTPSLPAWPLYLIVHLGLIIGVLLLARYGSLTPSRTLGFLRNWYAVFYVIAIFKMLGVLVPAVSPTTYDTELLAWDHRLFGCQPGAWFDGIASPALTELLRACWLSYFVMPFVVAVPLYRRKNRAPFDEAVLTLLLGWLISFLGYYLVPAWGPGYFPDAVPAPVSVTGEGVTQSIALTLFTLEGRMNDVFPSGHTIIALLILWLAGRNRLPFWWLLFPVVAGLLMGTVYLRYHYGVDVLGGALIAIAVAWIATRWHRGVLEIPVPLP